MQLRMNVGLFIGVHFKRIAFHVAKVHDQQTVAPETKGSITALEFRGVEEAKIYCPRERFKVISGENVVYDVVDSYRALLDKVIKERFVHGKC